MRAVETTTRKRSPGAPPDARFGAVSFSHRAGSTLNANTHFHVLATDGCYSLDKQGRVTFHEATDLTDEDIAAVTSKMRRRILRYMVRHDLMDSWDAQNMLQWEHYGGFSADASVRIDSWDRFALERVARYCSRPPFASSRLSRPEPDTIVYELNHPAVDGRTAVVFTPFQLLDRIASIIPPPRVHRHRYHGVLAPHAKLRKHVVASAGPAGTVAMQLDLAAHKMGIEPPPPQRPPESPQPCTDTTGRNKASIPLHHADADYPKTHADRDHNDQARRRNDPYLRARRRYSIMWAMLVARLFEVLPLVCNRCNSPMEILSFVTDKSSIHRILHHLGLPTEPPPVSPARDPPQAEFQFDQSQW